MGQLVDDLGHKTPGQLIRSADWNALVAAVESVEENLAQRVTDVAASLDGRLSGVAGQVEGLNSAVEDAKGQAQNLFDLTNSQVKVLNERVDGLEGQLDSLRGSLEPTLGERYRVTVESARSNHVIGELAEITARVTDLRGNPLDMSSEDDRPWIDFVALWGRFKPVSGFEVRGNSGDKTISVKANADGVAQVHLKSEHTEGFTDEVEGETAAFLKASLQSGAAIADAVLQAATPMEGNASGVYQALSAEYDRADAIAFHKYVDAYYAWNLRAIAGSLMPRPIHKWRDHTSTVLAFCKPGKSSNSPAQGLGVSSAQITFRDWISPWIILEYLANLKERVADVRNRLASKVTDDYGESVTLITQDIIDIIGGKGILGKQRECIAVRNALDALPVSQPPPFLPTLTRTIQDTVGIQQMHDRLQGAAFYGNGDQSVFKALNDALLRPEAESASVEDTVREATQSVELIGSSITELKNTVRFMEGRLDASLSEGGELQRIRADLNSVAQQIGSLQALDVADVQAKLEDFQLIGSRLQALETKIDENDEQDAVEVSNGVHADVT